MENSTQEERFEQMMKFGKEINEKAVKPKYRAGDVVHVRLDRERMRTLNREKCAVVATSDIIAHIPAPKPVVQWMNINRSLDRSSWRQSFGSRKEADFISAPDRTCVLRLEWPDGDTSKKPIVTVEDV